jgi:hypothetical protein
LAFFPVQDPRIADLRVKMSVDPSTRDVMDEALRAKDAAERKFHARNMKGANQGAKLVRFT